MTDQNPIDITLPAAVALAAGAVLIPAAATSLWTTIAYVVSLIY